MQCQKKLLLPLSSILFVFVSHVSCDYVKALYGENQWPQMIYKQISGSVSSLLECAAFCHMEKSACQTFLFENSKCLLGNSEGFFDFIPTPQNDPKWILVSPGKSFQIECQTLKAISACNHKPI